MNNKNNQYTFTPVKFRKHTKLNKITEHSVILNQECLSLSCDAQIMLDYYLYKHFDSSLIFNQKRIEKQDGYIFCLSAGYPLNFYTYHSLEGMCQDILLFSSYLKQSECISEQINAYLQHANNDADSDCLLPNHIRQILAEQPDYYESFVSELRNLMQTHSDDHLMCIVLP